jgi:phenylacetate-CoA ligase
VLVAEDGSEIPWVAMNMHDDTFDCVCQFQFYQDTPGKATLKLVVAEGFGEQHIARIRTNLSRKLQDRLEFTMSVVDSIPLSPRGKAIYVDQRIPTASQSELAAELGGDG